MKRTLDRLREWLRLLLCQRARDACHEVPGRGIVTAISATHTFERGFGPCGRWVERGRAPP